MKILPFNYRIAKEKVLQNTTAMDLSAWNCVGVLGPVGSGKSLLIKLLADMQLRDLGAFSEYSFCAYLSQDLTQLFTGNTPQSILELYADTRYTVGKHFDRGLFDRYARRMRIEGLLEENRRLLTYSEGERQRLGICLAAAVKAKVCILDEPTTALDTESRMELYRIIADIRKRARIFMISHRLADCLYVCDYLILMEDLHIRDHYPLQEIIEKADILSYYLPQSEDEDV
ncbi:MAG: ATP-binding cassette domain-containing protein [Candidatus Neomarinimicrobiota bacterium]|jgi:ABC-type multidrug transport system ATPase subunit|nr:ATP-binding cassette domain-containing protein [Candidatus Neomarinimicrobiota bacterium]MDD3967120.1 ATP-binding cassette domain-containing protein [Candidatus Neomarinimicrobiota bacterium]MDX9780519.1 ATP-binding cassette domain-containing protein [bacterium]